eukprot:360061-Chlamydomonas_euryale.AAC.5
MPALSCLCLHACARMSTLACLTCMYAPTCTPDSWQAVGGRAAPSVPNGALLVARISSDGHLGQLPF